MFTVGSRVADSESYKAPNVSVEQERKKRLMDLKKLAVRHGDLANTLKTGLMRRTLKFYEHNNNPVILALSDSQRLNVEQSSRRPTETKLFYLFLT